MSTDPPGLVLYGTVGCHLCEVALALVEPYLEEGRLGLSEVDIADSDALMDKYGITIPVLKREDSGAELNWPFGNLELSDFLACDPDFI